MRALCNIMVWAVFFGGSSLLCQETKPDHLLGYLRFVNATGFEGRLHVTLDGLEVNPAGYVTGQATGAVGFTPGPCRIAIRHETLGELKVSLELKAAVITTVVMLPLVEKEPKAGEAPNVELLHHVLESSVSAKGRAPTLTILQTTPEETMELKVGNQTWVAKRMKPDSIMLNGVGEFASVTVGGKSLATLNFTDPADQVLVIFINEKGVAQQVSFSNDVH
jgi:hypothetical protein